MSLSYLRPVFCSSHPESLRVHGPVAAVARGCCTLCLLIWQAAFYIHTIKAENLRFQNGLQLSYTAQRIVLT